MILVNLVNMAIPVSLVKLVNLANFMILVDMANLLILVNQVSYEFIFLKYIGNISGTHCTCWALARKMIS